MELYNKSACYSYIGNVYVDGPGLISMSPSAIYAGETTTMTLDFNKTNITQLSLLDITCSGYLEKYYNIPISGLEILSPTRIRFNLVFSEFAHSGYLNLNVKYNNLPLTSNDIVLVNGFDPELVSVSPTTGFVDEALELTIVGKNTKFSQLTSLTIYSYNYYNSSPMLFYSDYYQVIDDNMVKATFNTSQNMPTGIYTLYVNSGNFYESLYNAFSIINRVPQILNFYPSIAYQNELIQCLIKCKDMKLEQNNPAFCIESQLTGSVNGYLGCYSGSSLNVLSNDSAMFNVAVPVNAATGFYSVSSTDPTASLNNAIYINKNMGGSGSISGYLYQNQKTNAPAANQKLNLTDENGNVLLVIYTDENGFFEFKYLPYGNYKIVPDNINHVDCPSYTIDLTNPTINSLNLNLDEDFEAGSVELTAKVEWVVFPVPFTTNITILSPTNPASALTFALVNSLGIEMSPAAVEYKDQKCILDLRNLSAGMYLLKVYQKDGELVFSKMLVKAE